MFRRPDNAKKQQEKLKISKFFEIIHLKWNTKALNNYDLKPKPDQKQKENIEDIQMENDKKINLVDIALYNLEELDVS